MLILSLFMLASQSIRGETQVLRACGHHDYPPYNWNQDAQPLGIGFDVTKEIFEGFGIIVVPVNTGTWKRCLHAVENGEIDVVVAAYATDQRKLYANFTSTPLSEDKNIV